MWLTQAKIAQLFGVQRPAITKHLKNIFDSGELQENSVSSILEHTADDGKKYSTKFYNLDAIISVGYRVNSAQATHFRIWATQVLKEYIIKGFAMNDERLKNPDNIFGQDYFEEQLARIRDIRSSERRLYQKITDIYAQCSTDYDPNTDITKQFFATVQNKLHFAITGKTFVCINRRWRKLLKDLGIKGFRFHDLRHTFATYALLKKGGDLVSLQATLGHANKVPGTVPSVPCSPFPVFRARPGAVSLLIS